MSDVSIPPAPRMLHTVKDKIYAVLENETRSVTVDEIDFQLEHVFQLKLPRHILHNRLSEMVVSKYPRARRVARGAYVVIPWQDLPKRSAFR